MYFINLNSKNTSSGGSIKNHPKSPQHGRPQPVNDFDIQDAALAGELKESSNDSHPLEAFESWVRSGEWKKSFPFGAFASVDSEEVSKFGRPTEPRAISNARWGRSSSIQDFNTARFNQGQGLVTGDNNISGPANNPGVVNSFGPANNHGMVNSFGLASNHGMINGFGQATNHGMINSFGPANNLGQASDGFHQGAAVAQANPHAGSAGVQAQHQTSLYSECKSQPV
ncbi:hypothetical protein B0H65DRAFT_565992 [Neurospora tetraspora]|uniref:Uncharacterized protein n=1 Tax=Neurospora tetraspora TaxID=94610 RepID=A0AAE0MKN2_9PEZI|nr:hypothetical protein B0H65DRAFT_565992 [Neurospora tetraspora]